MASEEPTHNRTTIIVPKYWLRRRERWRNTEKYMLCTSANNEIEPPKRQATTKGIFSVSSQSRNGVFYEL